MLTQVHMSSRLLSSLAGALYAAAILLSNTQLGFLLQAMPWLLSATCGATLDLLVSLCTIALSVPSALKMVPYIVSNIVLIKFMKGLPRSKLSDALLLDKVHLFSIEAAAIDTMT